MARLIAARDGMADAEVEAFFARLVLLLANEIADIDVLLNAVMAATPQRKA